MPLLEQVIVAVGGQPFRLWDEVGVHASVKDAARMCTFKFPDTPGAPIWPSLFSGEPLLTVTASGTLIFTGYVDHRAPELAPETFTVTISARSRAQDAIDSSVDHTKPDYVNSNVLKMAQDQDEFGIGFAADFTPDGFDRWRPNVGHTLWESLEPLCEEEDATMAGQADGSVKITRAGATARPQAGPIVEGVNVWQLGATFDDSAQHSHVHEHGQSYKGTGNPNIAIHALATNANVTRYRPYHHHHDQHTDLKRIRRRATRRRDKEQGEGLRAKAQMRGWRDSGGMLWTPGNKVFVKSASNALCQYMLIEGVDYRQDGKESGGTVSYLDLVDPRAHGGTGGGVDKSGAAWAFDNAGAS